MITKNSCKQLLVISLLLFVLSSCNDQGDGDLQVVTPQESGSSTEMRPTWTPVPKNTQGIDSDGPEILNKSVSVTQLSVSSSNRDFTIPDIVDLITPSMLLLMTESSDGDLGSGSAFVYSEDGFALTNYHVVAGAKEIWALVSDQNGNPIKVLVELLGSDSDLDVAVIKLEDNFYEPARLGFSNELKVGEEVIAFGYPLADLTGAELVVTKGMVSSLRNDGLADVIQHQAAVNPGNSGGPLVNDQGLIVGINTYVLRRSEGNNIEGFNVAIAIDEIVSKLDDLENRVSEPNPAGTLASQALSYFFEEEYANAIEKYSKAIDLDPKDSEAWYERGVAYMELEQYEEAIKDFTEAIRLNPDDGFPYFYRADAYYESDQFQKSVHDYDVVIKMYPSSGDAFNNRGLSLTQLGYFEDALQDFERAIEFSFLDLHIVHYNRSDVYFYLRDADSALTDLDKAIILAPDFADSYTARAQVYYDLLGMPEKALADLDKAIQLDPSEGHNYNARGTIYRKKGLIDLALDDLNNAIVLDPSQSIFYGNRGALYCHIDKCDLGLTDLNKALVLDPKDGWAYSQRGVIHQTLENFDLAVSDYNIALELIESQPLMDVWDPSTVLGNRGVLYLNIEEYELAIADFSEAIALNPNVADTYIARAQAYQGLSSFEEALEDLDKALAMDSSDHPIYEERGGVLLEMERYEEAISDFEVAITQDPLNSYLYFGLGFAYLSLEDFEKSLVSLNIGIGIDPTNAALYYGRASVHHALGNQSQAESDFSEAEKLDQLK